ncbi:hypothetical protein PAECIP112173_04459 [Paenibacillus sp. JJ-100]|uniref:restriction endonuclease subunit S n=1 Tax=Paenibacillus sp. JJ-100 TaxID=2974896 RepID=UPI0022FF67FC|nr:restriction endonuclease subunit S [Paenibacillus sp. JJ-100]CAI6084954.1 hypothetical protein PAECIP112173_04459 [Paenibacillus sp. JJ-100]
MSNKLWPKKKITWLFDVIGSGTTPPASNEMYYNSPDMAWLNTGDLKDSYIKKTSKHVSQQALDEFSALTVFPKDSLVMAMYGATIGKLGITKYETTTNQACCVLSKPREIITKFIFYWLMGHRAEIINLSQGGGQPNISQGIIRNIRIAVPPVELQNKIVNFIDKKFEETNQLIDKKEKMINLLEQQRQSIITEAVTKGLNPNVKMKDSGVEWIGEIPEHWEVKKVKHFANHVGSGKTPSGGSEVYLDEGVPFLRSLNVHFDGIRLKDLAFISEETNAEMKSSQVNPLDILLNITGASIGRTAIVPKDFGRANVNQHVCIIRLNQKKVYPFYFNMLMSSDVINQQIWFAQNGSSREGLNFVQVKELIFAIPPTLEEQREINKWVFNKQKAIFNLTSTVKEQIEKLKEYRQSLIYEAVTGKIEVSEMELDEVR